MKIEYIIQAIVAAVCVALAVWMLQACSTPKPVAETISNTEVRQDSTTNTTTETTTKETVKESDYSHTIEADSALTALQLRCDSLGNVLISALEQEQGKRTDLEVQLKDNVLKIQAIQAEYDVLVKGLRRDVERLEKEKQELSTHIAENISQEEKEPVIVEKPIPAVVKWFAWIGVAAVVLVLLRFALWIYKKFFLKV